MKSALLGFCSSVVQIFIGVPAFLGIMALMLVLGAVAKFDEWTLRA